MKWIPTRGMSYSVRKASMGSMEAAMRAGMREAKAAAINRTATATANIAGSRGFPLVQRVKIRLRAKFCLAGEQDHVGVARAPSAGKPV
jgi:hypothetical protein